MTKRKIYEVPKDQGIFRGNDKPTPLALFMERVNDKKISDPETIHFLEQHFVLMDRYIAEHKGFEWRLPFRGEGSPSIGNMSFSTNAIIYDWEREIFEDCLLEGLDPEEILEKKISKQVLTDADREVDLARKYLEHISS